MFFWFMMVNFGNSVIIDRLIKLPSEINLRLWYEVSARYPYILKVRTLSVEVPQWNTRPPGNYRSPVNRNTGEHYPNCCLFHNSVLREVEKWLRKFPDCCTDHQKLKETLWFDAKRYSGVANKVVRQILFTQYHILEHINATDWFDKITDYIIANVYSFGDLPHGYGNPIGLEHYLKNLKLSLKEANCLNSSEISKEKIHQLNYFIDGWHPDPLAQNRVLLDLYSIYQKWYKTFPFGLCYFRELCDEFEENSPVLAEKKYNSYLNRDVIVIRTDVDMIEGLIKQTLHLIKKVNSKELLKKGAISDVNEHLLELISEKHRIRQTSLIEDYSKEEIEYVKILEKWLENEKKYFDEVTPLVNMQPKDIEKEPFYDNSLWERTKVSSDWVPYDKTVFGCLNGVDKSQDGAAKNLSKKQLAMCYHYLAKDERLKGDKLIHDQIDNGSAYRKSFQAYSQWLDPKSKNAPKAHETMYNYVRELMKKKNFSPSEIKDLHVVMDAIGYFPSVKKLIDDDLDGLE